jgi:YcaO-like protein with predicted kinase domain
MIANPIRLEARKQIAEVLRRTSYGQLLRYGITSYREITNLDVIGTPSIWICNRPGSTTISVTSGKSTDRLLALSGSIVEGIEFWASENPKGEYTVSSYNRLADTKQECDLLPFEDYPWAADNVVDRDTPLPWESVDRVNGFLCGNPIGDTTQVILPSNAIWLGNRIQQQFLDVPKTSNGIASGTSEQGPLYSLQDAVLQGLYELIERDGWTISQYLQEQTGDLPRKVPLVDLPDDFQELVDRIRHAGLYPFLFDCTTDLGIPVFGCALLGTDGVGLFGGYGCHQDPAVAAQRAVVESVQGRLCYISGARDDMFRRNFILMKRTESAETIKQLEAIEPVASDWTTYAGGDRFFVDVETELWNLVQTLQTQGINRLYYRLLDQEQFGDSILTVARVIAPQLEGVWCDSWQSNGRAIARLESRKLETSLV